MSRPESVSGATAASSTTTGTGAMPLQYKLSRVLIPLKVKFLAVLMLILLSSLGIFFYVASQTFMEDKKLFVMDLNLSGLKAMTSELRMEIKSRLEELQVLAPRVYASTSPSASSHYYRGLSEHLPNELLALHFIAHDLASGTVAKQFVNDQLLAGRGFSSELVSDLTTQALGSSSSVGEQGVVLINRSQNIGGKPVGILTFQIQGTFLGAASKNITVVADFLQDFLRKQLQRSELAEQFLILGNGTLLAHPSLEMTVEYAHRPIPHPIVERLQKRVFSRESVELNVQGEPYLANVSETGFADVYAVSQIRRHEAFLALRTLFEKTVVLALIIFFGAVIVSIYFAARLTTNIRKLKIASQRIGVGDLDTELVIKSRDEIQNVAESFRWMAGRIRALIEESTLKARMEDELETARLVQETILSPPELRSDAVEIASHYSSATQCGGDYWDTYLVADRVTFLIGDATGHGAPAAIVTAVVKSCFSTLNSLTDSQSLSPDVLLSKLNSVLYNSCRGKLLMTMSVLQLDLNTGELVFANAGHESPLLLRASQNGGKARAEVLFSRGERLGFSAEQLYRCETQRLGIGDIVMLYTDGVSEARNASGQEWGERALKKVFAGGGVRDVDSVRTEILDALATHTQGAAQDDDVTFVLFNWLRSAEGLGESARPGFPEGEAA